MKKLLICRKIWLSVGIASALLGILGLAAIPLFAIKLKYAALAISIAFVANACYGCPFYFIAYKNSQLFLKVYDTVIKDGVKELSLIAARLEIKEECIEKVLSRALKRDCFSEYSISSGLVVKK